MRSNSLRLGTIVPAAIISLIVLSAAALVFSAIFADRQLETALKVMRGAGAESAMVEELIDLERGLELDIVSTQESLTDVSATRGLDGLDDGFQLAEESAASLKEKAKRVVELSQALKSDGLAVQVQSLLSKYDQFYASGVVMAKTYVEGGPEAGNKLMADFDAVSDALQSEIEAASLLVKDIVKNSKATAEANAAELEAQTAFFVKMVLAIDTAMVAIGVGIAIFISRRLVKPVTQITEYMTNMAGGDLARDVPQTDRRDEIGEMANSILIFRDNTRQKVRLEARLVEDRETAERERLERVRLREIDAEKVKFAIDSLATGLNQMADGNLTHRIDAEFIPHMDQLRQDFNMAVGRLQQALSAVGENARAIAAGSNEMKSAADDLSKRTEQQAASIEETAAALEEITTTVGDSSRRAEEAGSLVASTRQGAEKSGEIVRQAITAMGQIESSSNEISNIIGVIDDIAFQTNLLALNAGVEAARAGEAGKGFAVVAQEVRELAQRSANAAKEIKALITTSGDQVKNGVVLVGQTGEALDKIVAQVQDINKNIVAIVESSREQATGLKEINTAVNTMDQGTQQNAAMVEQSTAASHSLAAEAAALFQLLSQFQVGNASSAASAQDRPAAARAPTAARADHAPKQSPARRLAGQVARAFGGGGSTAAAKESWEEF